MYHIFFIASSKFSELRIKWGKIMKLLCPLNIIRLREKNTTVNNILNTQGKSYDGLKLCRKLIFTVLFLIFTDFFLFKTIL